MRNALAVVVLCLVLAPAARAEECEPTPNPNTGQQPTQPDPTPLPEGPQHADPGATRQPDPGDSTIIVVPPGLFDSTWDPPIAPYAAGGDHSALKNLEGDTHTQYLNRSGTRPMTGDLGLGMATVFSALDHRLTSGLWFQWPPPKADPKPKFADGFMEERGPDTSSPAGQVIQPYVTGTAIVDGYVDPADEEDFGHPPVFERDDLEESDGACGPSILTADSWCSEIRSSDSMSAGTVRVDPVFTTTSRDDYQFGNTSSSTMNAVLDLGASCNDTQHPVMHSSGSMSTDPLFSTTSRGDYRFGNTSLSIDACTTQSGPDLDSVSRPQVTGWDGDGDDSEVGTGAPLQPEAHIVPATDPRVFLIRAGDAPAAQQTMNVIGYTPALSTLSQSTYWAGTTALASVGPLVMMDAAGNDGHPGPLGPPSFETATGVSALLGGQSAYQALNVYSIDEGEAPSPLQVVEDALLSGEDAQDRAEEYARGVKEAREKELLAKGIGDEVPSIWADVRLSSRAYPRDSLLGALIVPGSSVGGYATAGEVFVFYQPR